MTPPRITPWNRFLRVATRALGSAVRVLLSALILGAPFPTEVQVVLALLFSLCTVAAFVSERRKVVRIQETAPAEFGPGQVRLSLPLELHPTSGTVLSAVVHLILLIAVFYAAAIQPALLRPCLLLWGFSICISAFRQVAFHLFSTDRQYIVIPESVWEEANRLFEQRPDLDTPDFRARAIAFRQATASWGLPPRSRKFLFEIIRERQKLLVETPEENP